MTVVFGTSVRMMEEDGSYVRDYKGLLYGHVSCNSLHTRLMFGPIVSLSQRLGDRPELSIIYHIRTVRPSPLHTAWKGELQHS
jgi:hypothetical protein